MYRICLVTDQQTACSYYRAMLPYKYTHKYLKEKHNVILEVDPESKTYDQCDAFVFQRSINPKILCYLLELHSRGKKICFDLDDNLFAIPDHNEAKNGYGYMELLCLAQCLKFSDSVSVSTEPLREVLSAYHDKESIYVVPNYCDQDLIRKSPIIHHDNPKILWGGSPTHSEDLKILMPAITHCINKGYQIIFMGHIPEYCVPVMESARNLTFIPIIPLISYFRLISHISPSIALIPLASKGHNDYEFNVCKSAIKLYEFGLAGAIPIVSNTVPYSDPAKKIRNTIVAENDGWIDAIEKTIAVSYEDDARCNTRSDSLDFTYSYHSNILEWVNHFLRIAGLEPVDSLC